MHIIPSFLVDKASCTRQFESELSLHSLASLFPIKERFFRIPPSPFPKGAPPLTKPSSIVFTTPSVPLVGDRNLRRKDVNRPTRCSEPLRSKVGGPSKVFAILCGMGPPGVIAPHCDAALYAYTSPLNNQLYNLHHPTDYKDSLLYLSVLSTIQKMLLSIALVVVSQLALH